MSAPGDRTILQQRAQEVLARHGLVLEDIEQRRSGGLPLLRLIVDLPPDQLGSADLDTVAEASRELSELVDTDDALLGPSPVLLELTTPGLDRPLRAPHHFQRARGRLLTLTAADGTAYRARLLALEDEVLQLRQEPGRDERGRPRKRPVGTPEHLALPLAEVVSAHIEAELDPPADLAELLAAAAATDPAESARNLAEEPQNHAADPQNYAADPQNHAARPAADAPKES